MAYWAVVQTVANRENFAAEHIKQAGFDIFVPKTKVKIDRRWQIVALFPGYLFVRLIDRWRAVERASAVLRLIKFGETPARCPDDEIAKILDHSDKEGLVRLPKRPKASCPSPPFAVGAQVKIIAGSFCGLDAIYAGSNAQQRQFVLLELLGRKVPVELDADQFALTTGHRDG